MAIGPAVGGGAQARTHSATIVGSVIGEWTQANGDLETADTANLLSPYNITRAAFRWVKVPEGCKLVRARGRNDATATTVTTDPVIRLVGAWGTPNEAGSFSGTPTDSNYARFARIDYPSTSTSPSDDNATGQTLDLAATGRMEDASYEYSGVTPWYDCNTAAYVGILVETAANVTGGAAHAVYGDLLFG